MARQYIIGGLFPAFVNETGTRQYAVGEAFLNETVADPPGDPEPGEVQQQHNIAMKLSPVIGI